MDFLGSKPSFALNRQRPLAIWAPAASQTPLLASLPSVFSSYFSDSHLQLGWLSFHLLLTKVCVPQFLFWVLLLRIVSPGKTHPLLALAFTLVGITGVISLSPDLHVISRLTFPDALLDSSPFLWLTPPAPCGLFWAFCVSLPFVFPFAAIGLTIL